MAVRLEAEPRLVENGRAALARAGVGAVPALVGIVGASFVLRTLLAWLRATPVYVPDEYMYAELGRSLAATGHPLIRGTAAHFPALLQPLVTAPAWLVGDVELSYRLVQAIGALAMSLAAVPVFLLARRLGLGSGLALGLAALAVAVPDLLFSSWIVAEPLAYPLVLAAVAAATAAIARPAPRAQLAFVAFAGLAAFARVQFVVLPVCFLAATVLVGLRERRLRGALREQLLPVAVLAVPLAAALALGPRSALGIYRVVLDPQVEPLALVRHLGANAMVLLYASGWILAPGAILGLALGLVRPRSRPELAFASLAALLLAGLLLQAALYGAVDRVQERYVFYLLPLALLGFGLYAARGWPRRGTHALLAAGLVTLSAKVPLAGFSAARGKEHSPFLIAVARLEEALGSAGSGSLAIAGVVALLSAAAILGSLRPRLGTPVAVGLAFCACAATSAGAVLFDQRNAANVRASFLPEDLSWVDRAGLGRVALLRSLGALRTDSLQLFWNRSVDQVLLLPGAWPLDPFRSEGVRIASDGSLLVAGRPVERPLLVDDYGATIRLSAARPAARSQIYTLWRPEGRPRLALYLVGRYNDGWLARTGGVNLWPAPGSDELAGRLTFALTAPSEAGTVTIRFRLPGGALYSVRLRPGVRRHVSLRVCSRGPWQAPFAANVGAYLAGRIVSVRASEPLFHPDRSACAGRRLLEPGPRSAQAPV